MVSTVKSAIQKLQIWLAKSTDNSMFLYKQEKEWDSQLASAQRSFTQQNLLKDTEIYFLLSDITSLYKGRLSKTKYRIIL